MFDLLTDAYAAFDERRTWKAVDKAYATAWEERLRSDDISLELLLAELRRVRGSASEDSTDPFVLGAIGAWRDDVPPNEARYAMRYYDEDNPS